MLASNALADVADFFVGVGLDDTGIGALEHVGKEPDELVLLLGRPPAPIGAEGASRHLGEIEARKQNLSQLITAIVELGRRLKPRVAQNRERFVDGTFNLIGGHARAGLAGAEQQNQEQKSGLDKLFTSVHHLFSSRPST